MVDFIQAFAVYLGICLPIMICILVGYILWTIIEKWASGTYKEINRLREEKIKYCDKYNKIIYILDCTEEDMESVLKYSAYGDTAREKMIKICQHFCDTITEE